MKYHIVPLFAVALLSTQVVADQWPQYRGKAGDGKSSETFTVGSQPKTAWKVPTPLGFSSFSIADGRAFTLVAKDSLEHCVALDVRTGDELWSVALGSSEYEHGGGNAGARDNRGGDGPRSTPSTDGTFVYVYDSHMLLSCLNAKSGDLVWKQDIIKDFDGRSIKWLNATSPVLDGDVLYVGGGGANQSFIAFNKTNGDVIWKSGDETITHATPLVTEVNGTKQIVFFVQSGLVGVEASSGKELWRTVFPFSVSTAASPIASNDLVYCSAGYGVGAGLFKVKPSGEPDEIWFKANELMNHWSTPVVHDGHLYGIYEFKKYGEAPLQCVELATGEIKWSQRGFGPGNCILVDGKLVVLSDAGEVVLANANPDAYEELGRLKAVAGKCWSTPAYSDGKIFVRSTVEAACIDWSK